MSNYVIWHQNMTYVNKSIWPIFVSREASGPQQTLHKFAYNSKTSQQSHHQDNCSAWSKSKFLVWNKANIKLALRTTNHHHPPTQTFVQSSVSLQFSFNKKGQICKNLFAEAIYPPPPLVSIVKDFKNCFG